MKHGAKFVKGELEKIYNLLNVSFEYIDYSQVENDKRFIKIFELLMHGNKCEIKYASTSCKGELFCVNQFKVYIYYNKMEAKFFSEIEKKMDVKTLKDFEKEVRTKINDEFESLRKKNDGLSRVLMFGECQLWNSIKNGKYSWLKIKSDKKKKLFRLIEIYSQVSNLVENVGDINKKVDDLKKLKDAPIDEE